MTHKNLNGYVTAYERSTATQLYDVYGKCSTEKHIAFKYCQELMERENGYNGRIVSYNTFAFTFAFQNDDNFYVITKNYDYYMPKKELESWKE